MERKKKCSQTHWKVHLRSKAMCSYLKARWLHLLWCVRCTCLQAGWPLGYVSHSILCPYSKNALSDFFIFYLPRGATRCSKLVAECSAGSGFFLLLLLLNSVSETLCCPSVAGSSSWDLHTTCTSPAVACHLQKPIEHLSMTWKLTRKVFCYVPECWTVCVNMPVLCNCLHMLYCMVWGV